MLYNMLFLATKSISDNSFAQQYMQLLPIWLVYVLFFFFWVFSAELSKTVTMEKILVFFLFSVLELLTLDF